MPAIRDYNSDRSVASSLSYIDAPMPLNYAGDLLLAHIVSDATNIAGWALPSGWNTVAAGNSGASGLLAWKISSGNEPEVYRFDTNPPVADSMSAIIYAIEDVNQDDPFGVTPVIDTGALTSTIAVTGPGTSNLLRGITTNTDNSLVMSFVSHATTARSTAMGTRWIDVAWQAGAAEGAGGYATYLPKAGETPVGWLTRTSSTIQTYYAITVQIVPPTGGATVKPVWVVSDDSECYEIGVYTNSWSATNYITAFDTEFNPGAVAVLNGVTPGIITAGHVNPDSAAVKVGAASTTPTTLKASVRLSATLRMSFANKLLIVHTNYPTVGEVLRLGTVEGGLGVAIGLKSGSHTDSNNFSVWKVHYSNSPDILVPQLPLVVDVDNVSPDFYKGTLDSSDISAFGVFLTGKTTGVSVALGISGVWAVGETVISGGTSTRPINTREIAKVLGPETGRKTAFLQGKSLLLFQSVVIGNGGIYGAYFRVNAQTIEFPAPPIAEDRYMSFRVSANKVGLLYNPGASDTIIHTNAVITSDTRYKWGLHPSASASATYNFSGLTVVGAGAITLNKAITIDDIFLSNFLTADISNATITNSTLATGGTISDAITANGSTNFTAVTIRTASIAAGNYAISLPDLSIFSGCNFTGGGGHAIRLTTPGTVTSNGNTFTGFGANGSDGAAILNDSGGHITINVSGGTAPTVKNGPGSTTTVQAAVAVTIAANTSLHDAEIRIYDLDDDPPGSYGTELAGVEHNSATTFAFSGEAGNLVAIQIMKEGYKEFVQDFTIPDTNITLTVRLTPDLVA